MDYVEYYQAPPEKIRPWDLDSIAKIKPEGPDNNGVCNVVKSQDCKKTRGPSIKVTIVPKDGSNSRLMKPKKVVVKK